MSYFVSCCSIPVGFSCSLAFSFFFFFSFFFNEDFLTSVFMKFRKFDCLSVSLYGPVVFYIMVQ